MCIPSLKRFNFRGAWLKNKFAILNTSCFLITQPPPLRHMTYNWICTQRQLRLELPARDRIVSCIIWCEVNFWIWIFNWIAVCGLHVWKGLKWNHHWLTLTLCCDAKWFILIAKPRNPSWIRPLWVTINVCNCCSHNGARAPLLFKLLKLRAQTTSLTWLEAWFQKPHLAINDLLGLLWNFCDVLMTWLCINNPCSLLPGPLCKYSCNMQIFKQFADTPTRNYSKVRKQPQTQTFKTLEGTRTCQRFKTRQQKYM